MTTERMRDEDVQDWCATVGRLWPRVPYLTSDARDELLRARAAEVTLARAILTAPSACEWTDQGGSIVAVCHSCGVVEPWVAPDDDWHAPDCVWAAARREARALLASIGDDHADD